MQVRGATELLLIGSMFCVKRYIRKFIVFSSDAIIVLSTIIRKLYLSRMLPQTIVKMSSDQKTKFGACPLHKASISLQLGSRFL